MPAVLEERKKQKFTEYEEIMDEYFIKNQIIIKPLPDWIIPSIEKKNARIEITSAKQYVDYLNKELVFWNTNDPANLFESFSNKSALKRALDYFNRANEYSTNSSYKNNVPNELRQSTSCVVGNCLNSNTTLAKYLVTKFSGKSKNFIDGFKVGLSKDSVNFYSNYSDTLEGFYTALVFKKSFIDVYRFNEQDVLQLEKSISDANAFYSELNSRYTNSFSEHETMIESLKNQTEEHITKMNSDSTSFFEDCTKRRNELEVLYNEKLKLEEPAKYWQEMENDYKEKARFWVIMSVIVALVTMAGLVIVLALLPNLFSKDSHWIDVFKNSAIITIFLSIAVYILRLFVKLATSSFHLARDAKERNKLAYFYLALIAKGAVDEKERSIILNALFSRADTGLLKGDSAPTMPTGVTEIIGKLNN